MHFLPCALGRVNDCNRRSLRASTSIRAVAARINLLNRLLDDVTGRPSPWRTKKGRAVDGGRCTRYPQSRFMVRPSSHFTLADESLVTLLGDRVKGVWEGVVAFALRLTEAETGEKKAAASCCYILHKGTLARRRYPFTHMSYRRRHERVSPPHTQTHTQPLHHDGSHQIGGFFTNDAGVTDDWTIVFANVFPLSSTTTSQHCYTSKELQAPRPHNRLPRLHTPAVAGW